MQTRKKTETDISVPPVAKSISPGSNFYMHINANWIRHANMPKYASSQGVSEEIDDQIRLKLEKIVGAAQQQLVTVPNKELPDNTVLLGSLMQSAVDRSSQELSVKFVRSLALNLRCMRSVEDVGATLGEFIRQRLSNLLSVFTSPEERQSKRLRLTIGTGSTGLPDTSYQLVQTPGNIKILNAYQHMFAKIGEEFDIENLGQFVAIERIVAEALEESRGDDEVLMRGSELRAEFPAIPWFSMAKSAFRQNPSTFLDFPFLILSKRWLRSMNKWFRTWSLDNWRHWLTGTLFVRTLPLLPPPQDTLQFEIFGKRLRGEQEKTPQKLLGLKVCKNLLSGPLGQDFVECCVDPQLKRAVTALAEEIRGSALRRLDKTEWLEPKTRKKAALKIRDIQFGIAYPTSFPAPPKVALNPEQFIRNIFALETSDFEDDLRRANTELNPEKWEDAVFDVNAQYQNEGNRLILPAGILQYPFFDVNATDGWNFGGIGCTIGHELTHAFDVDGKNQDEHGNRKPWWTAKDNRNQNQKTRSIIALQNRTDYFGQPINGTLTLSENIADLGGVAIALAALKERLDKRRVSVEERKKQLCQFFVSQAISWRTKEKKKKALQSILTDMHSPPFARVNNVVRQFDDWQECFNIKPGQPLQTAPEERIRIF